MKRIFVLTTLMIAACQSVDIPEGSNPITYRSPQDVCEARVDPSLEWTRFFATNAGVAIKNATRDDRADYDRKIAECLRGQQDRNGGKGS